MQSGSTVAASGETVVIKPFEVAEGKQIWRKDTRIPAGGSLIVFTPNIRRFAIKTVQSWFIHRNPYRHFTSTLSASRGKHNRGFGTVKNVGSSFITLEPASQPGYSCLLFSGRRRRAVAQWFNFNINQSRRARKQLPLHQQWLDFWKWLQISCCAA